MNNNIAPPPYSPPGVPPPVGFRPPPNPEYPAPPAPVFQPPVHEIHYHPPAANTVIITEPRIVIRNLGPDSHIMNCPNCHYPITSRVETEPSTKTHLFALFLCLFGCWPCCFLPYFMDTCQSKNHYCPRCAAFLGSFEA